MGTTPGWWQIVQLCATVLTAVIGVLIVIRTLIREARKDTAELNSSLAELAQGQRANALMLEAIRAEQARHREQLDELREQYAGLVSRVAVLESNPPRNKALR